MSYCNHCGTENRTQSKFCRKCSQPLRSAGSKPSKLLWSILPILGILILAAGAFFLLRGKEEDAPLVGAGLPAALPTSQPANASATSPPTAPLQPIFNDAAGTSNLYIEYILDASESMNESLEDDTIKRTVAGAMLIEHIKAFPPATNFGLRAYGHRVAWQGQETASCEDIELIGAPATGQLENFSNWLNNYDALGMTPIADSLQQAMADFDTQSGDKINTLILLSDGIETCGGDPCQLVQDLQAQGIEFTVHVIGLSVDQETRSQLVCISDESNGQYYDVYSQVELIEALNKISEEILPQEYVTALVFPTPAPTLAPEPTPTFTPIPISIFSETKLGNLTYHDIDESDVTLVDGRFEINEPPFLGFSMISEQIVRTTLNQQPVALVPISLFFGANGSITFLAIVIQQNGELVNIATTELGFRTYIETLTVEENRIIVEVTKQLEPGYNADTQTEFLSYQWSGDQLELKE